MRAAIAAAVDVERFERDAAGDDFLRAHRKRAFGRSIEAMFALTSRTPTDAEPDAMPAPCAVPAIANFGHRPCTWKSASRLPPVSVVNQSNTLNE